MESPTLAEFVDVYLAQHEGEPETTDKLRCSPAIAAWRMTIPPGHRFEATQALRQLLARAVSWGLLDVNPAKLGVENAQRRYTEKRPFDSWDELYALAGRLGPRYGPMVLFAAATGLRPGEWLALEQRDIDRDAQVVCIRRTFRNGRIMTPQDEGERARCSVAGDRVPACLLAERLGFSFVEWEGMTFSDGRSGPLSMDGQERVCLLVRGRGAVARRGGAD